MRTVNTVLGPLDSDKLGRCLMHEHLIASAAGIPQTYEEILGNGYKERVIQGLREAKKGGFDTIVDATTLDLGRDVNLMIEASRLTGLNIIAVTGWWLEEPVLLKRVNTDQFAEVFIREIKQGISGTKAKAGILKASSDISGVTPFNEKILRAIARAHRQTEAPIMLHSHAANQVGRQQLAILKEEGVDLRRVKVDHCADTTDIEYLTWLAEQGCYLGFERFPGKLVSTAARIKTLKSLIDAGYTQRILLSHDWQLADTIAESAEIHEKYRQSVNPYGFLYLNKVVFPRLGEMGISESTINRILTDNPRRYFEGS